MDDLDDKEIMQIMIKSQKKAYQTALETAIRSGTSLVVMRKGKLVEIKPKYKYVLVPIKSKKKKAVKSSRKK
ncbi:MAG TPA: hypothetical protein VMR37_07385 [Rhabdochlamydiaceae bacterium]|jgi:hypothetical protein|nr:hypothetical protein [Rhabdochlamydiaceae bacterium]